MSESIARELPVDLQAAIDGAHQALSDLSAGRVDSSREVYRHADGITLFGAYGGHETGWTTIGRRLEAIAPLVAATGGGSVAVETLAAAASGDLAYTVELEHHASPTSPHSDPEDSGIRTLRVTQVYTRASGQWKLVHRHADPLSDVRPALSARGWASSPET